MSGDCFLTAIEIGSLHGNDFIYFDNLSLYHDEMAPLVYEPRPKRGVEMADGQAPGLNTGPGTLPFPRRVETILPVNHARDFETALEEEDGSYIFRYHGDDGTLEYTFTPRIGTLGDITARWGDDGDPFQPLSEGGPRFNAGSGPVEPDAAELLSLRKESDAVIAEWRMKIGDRTADVTYTLHLWQKFLVVDVACPGGLLEEFRFGSAANVDRPRLIKIPYLWYWHGRPTVLLTGDEEHPLFTFACVDWYRTNGTEFWAENKVGEHSAVYNGGVSYRPKTDGSRNDCFERIFLTVSPRFEEVLPTVDNPVSPWKEVTGTRLYRNNGFCSNRESPEIYGQRWKEIARYGIRKAIVTNHESGWSDYWYESAHTMRTRAARLKGGDKTARDLTRQMQDLGFRYADASGTLWSTSDALVRDVHTRSQVYVRYDSGLELWVNGNRDENWKTEHAVLPPNGWYAQTADGTC
jgi:hypothetical protein